MARKPEENDRLFATQWTKLGHGYLDLAGNYSGKSPNNVLKAQLV
jgi:hypothetical protein